MSSAPLPDSPDNIPPKLDAPPPAAENAPLPVAATQDDKTMGMLCHLLGAFMGFIGPLIIWLIKKDQSKFVDDQGKEALNFHIVLLILHFIGGATACFTFGAINGVAGLIGIIFGIIGGLEANKGVAYRYPFNIRLIT